MSKSKSLKSAKPTRLEPEMVALVDRVAEGEGTDAKGLVNVAKEKATRAAEYAARLKAELAEVNKARATAKAVEAAARQAVKDAKADAKARAAANANAIAEAASAYGEALAASDATLADAARIVAHTILRTGLKVTAEAMAKGCGADRLPATAANYASRLNAIAAAHGKGEEVAADARRMLDGTWTQGGVFKVCEAVRDALGAKSSVGRKSNVETAKGAEKGPTQQQVETQEAAKVEAEAAHEAATVAAVVESGNAEATLALCAEALAAFRVLADSAHKLGNKALAGIFADATARVIRHRDGVKVASI